MMDLCKVCRGVHGEDHEMVVIISKSLVRLSVCVPFESVVIEASKIEGANFPLLGTVFLLTLDQIRSNLPRC